MNSADSIKRTAEHFEQSFAENSYYNRQTQDDKHLDLILNSLVLSSEKKILDLGTGSGYLAFPLAERNRECHIIGLDIVEKTIARNQHEAESLNLKNLSFISYNGKTFPFEAQYFDIIVSRYAIHHFPDIDLCFREISRALQPGGQLFISDPTPYEIDKNGFVDQYMQMKKDGHIKFYTEKELNQLARKFGLEIDKSIYSEIRFPRKNSSQYLPLLKAANKEVLDAYQVELKGEEIFITEKVLNLSFRKGLTNFR